MVAGCSVLIVAWADVYPEAIAVMIADPGALLVKLTSEYVWPPLMVTEAGTEAIVLFDEDSVTNMPPSGAFAGELAESWS